MDRTTQTEPHADYGSTLSAEARRALVAAGKQTTVTAHRTVLRAGDETRDVWFIRRGLLKVVQRNGRKIVVLALRGPRDVIGDTAHLTGTPVSASVVAISPVEALHVPGEDFAAFRKRFPEATESLCRTLAERLREADRDRVAAASLAVGQRLARYLLKIVYRYGTAEPGGGMTIAHVTQSDLAGCIGAGQRTVAGELGDWRDRGIVSTSRRYLTVHRPDALKRIVGPPSPPT